MLERPLQRLQIRGRPRLTPAQEEAQLDGPPQSQHQPALRARTHILCRCGRLDPSLGHLVWSCPEYDTLRALHNVRAPATAAEERLLAVATTSAPGPPQQAGVLAFGLQPELVRHLRDTHEKSGGGGGFRWATDGSAVGPHSAAAMAWCYGPTGTIYTWAADVPLEDRSSFAAERWALVSALCALAVAPPPNEGTVDDGRDETDTWWGLVDCKAVLRCLHGDSGKADAWRAHAELRAAGRLAELAHVRCQWVPSHGKQPRWAPDNGESADTARRLNQAADAAALQRVRDQSQRQEWRAWEEERRQAEERQLAALGLALAIQRELEGLPLPAGASA